MEPTVRQLRGFVAVAEELHFGRAATRLHMSPSALSEQISTIERGLGRALFRRSSRAVQLTDHGKQLLPLARTAIGSMDDVRAWAVGADSELRVGLMVSSPVFQAVLAEAARRLPDLAWQIRQLGFLGCYDALVVGDVDCAFVAEAGEPSHADVEALPLWDEEPYLLVATDHRLAGYESLHLADLAGETFVSVDDEALASRWYASVMGPDGIPHRLLPIARSFDEVLDLAAVGIGVNICGASAATTYPRPGVRFIPLVDAPKITTYLCLRTGHRPAAVDAFARLAVDVVHGPH
ncbi:LysR family transcriptional regulator [Spelaeicoccus albus]|uniref:DNA-binding transcriptional LysR family regulator n=1 Tax=Spelaeicoccus albus TaxID=1280376 RepID=A0A7Z0D1B6_9MICO|nr:LysR substrate-binding domain-containing protein [Spelaeicoccus albus]NYI66743.1 DNA-binding transcriptional LysR family regulator [Spelaeicoccus albus]